MSQHQIVIPTKDKLFNLGEFSLRRPGNMITAVILVVGFVLTFIRFTQGIGSITNLSDTMPWGMWIGFDLLCGVCLAAGGYFTTVACYVMGMKHFHSAVRPAVTTAFLGYAFVVFALLYDLGHPLRLPYMFFFPGTTSVLFEVGLCVATYLTVLFIEFSVAPMEWLSCKFPFLKKWRKVVVRCTFILTIFGKSADEIQSAVRRKTEQSNLIRHGIPLYGNGCLGLLIVGAKAFRLLVRGKMTFMQASGVAVKFQHRDPC